MADTLVAGEFSAPEQGDSGAHKRQGEEQIFDEEMVTHCQG